MINKLWSTYKKLSVVVRASLWFMMCTMLQKCLTLITTPIFTRIMDTEQYGYFSTYLSITTIFTVILTLNFDTCAYMNGISKFETEKEKDQLASSLLSLTMIITIVFGVIVFLLKNRLSLWLALPQELILLMSLEILFIPPVKFWMVKQRFSYKYVSVVAVTLGMLLVNNILGVILVLNSTLNQAVMRISSIVVVQFIVGVFIYIYYFRKSGWFNLTKYWKYGLRLNLPLIPHGLSIMILSFSDRIMINTMVGATQVGIYGVAYSAGQIINAIKLSLVDALRPWVYEKLKRKEYKEIKGICQFIFIMNILLTFIVVGLAPEIIHILASEQYYEAIYIIPAVAASTYFTFIYNICAIVELYYEKNKKVMVASVIAAITNIILNYCCIPKFGYLSAGYTTLFSYMVLSILHLFFLNRIRKEEMDGIAVIDIKLTVILSLVVLGSMMLFTFLYAYTWIRLIVVLAIVMICFFMRKKFIIIFKSLRSIKKK